VRLLGTLIALALLVVLLFEQGWDEILAALRQIAPWRMALALLLMLVSRLAVAARWHMLLRSGGLPVSARQTLKVNFAGLFATNFLPTTIGGDLVRMAGALQLGWDGPISMASLIADRLVGMAGMALMAPFGLPALWSYLTLSPAPSLASALLPRLTHKILAGLRRLAQALRLWLCQPRALLLALLWSGVHMACLFTIIDLLLGGVGETMSFWHIGGLYSLVYFVTLIPISINGYGLQELSMTLIFSNLGHAPVSHGLTAALLFRTLMMLASLPGALFVPGILASTRARPTPPLQEP
jgi:uncharacterized membrane protein YbhN (UPF0104 family)